MKTTYPNSVNLKIEELKFVKEVIKNMKTLQDFYNQNKILNREDLFHIEHSIFIWDNKAMKITKLIEQIN